MKVWKITAPNHLEQQEINDAQTPEGACKIKMLRAGISISDINIFRGAAKGVNYPIVPGRQGVGIISEIGENDRGLKKSDRVVIESHISCRNCVACKSGKPDECAHLQVMGIDTDGLIRDFAVVPVENIYQLPTHVKDAEAQFVEHIAMAIKAFNELECKKGDHVAIVGASIIGIVLAQIALYYQAIPILIDANQHRLDSAKDLDIYYMINSSREDVAQKVLQITGGRGCDCVAYMASSNYAIQHVFDYCGAYGKLAIVGWEYILCELNANISTILSKQLRVTGVNNCYRMIPTAINMLANKAVSVKSLISREITFADVPATFDEMAQNPYNYDKVLIKL